MNEKFLSTLANGDNTDADTVISELSKMIQKFEDNKLQVYMCAETYHNLDESVRRFLESKCKVIIAPSITESYIYLLPSLNGMKKITTPRYEEYTLTDYIGDIIEETT